MEVALERADKGWLQKWWRDKYQRPSKDPLLQEYTEEELYVEYLEDEIEKAGGAEIFALAQATRQSVERDDEIDVFEGIPEDARAEMEGFFKRGQPPEAEEPSA